MKNDIHNVLGDSIANSIEGIVDCLDKMDLKPEEIVDRISDMHELVRSGMHLTALSKGNEELADKIDKANESIKLKRIKPKNFSLLLNFLFNFILLYYILN